MHNEYDINQHYLHMYMQNNFKNYSLTSKYSTVNLNLFVLAGLNLNRRLEIQLQTKTVMENKL